MPTSNEAVSPPTTNLIQRTAPWLVLLFLTLGAGLRLFDLTDPPIDFHPTRQLRGAIVARGIYYQLLPSADPVKRAAAQAFWDSTGQYEPSILESVVALGYLALGGEAPWLARLVNTLIWLVGGVALFDLARRLTGNHRPGAEPPFTPAATAAGLVSLAFYLVLPFSVQASRSFQPDPGMVVWITLASYFVFRWGQKASWRSALMGGAFAGLAILTKAVALYTLAWMLVLTTLVAFSNRSGTAGAANDRGSKAPTGWLFRMVRILSSPQVWAIAVLTILPSLWFYLGRSGRASEYFSSWTLALSHLLQQPQTYLRWGNLVQELLTPLALITGFIGIALSSGLPRALLGGLWLGYLSYGLFLPYQMTSHNYYHLQLVPITALSLAPAVHRGFLWLIRQRPMWKLMVSSAALILLAYSCWQALVPLYGRDYRNEPAYWQEIASHLPQDGKIIALTQDYGYRLMYYGWRKVTLWPNRGEIKLSILRGSEKEFQDFFLKRIQDKRYFLITAFNQYTDQPALQETLEENYHLVAEGQGYLIYDLTQPNRSGGELEIVQAQSE